MSLNINVVCRVGALLTIMSFVGSVNSIMKVCGLFEAFQCCYGSNVVTHIFPGKAIERAVRAHFLTESSFFVLLLNVSAVALLKAECLYENVVIGSNNFNDI